MYVAALSREVEGEAMFHRRLLGTPVLLYRKGDGTPVALHDRCPHRFAPLHLGWREGDDVVCQYHALKFDCSGKCSHNPHGKGKIPSTAQVRSFPVEERDGFIWIWMGEKDANPELLPQHPKLVDGPKESVGYTYMYVKGNYQLITDNVMDLSHVDHVHGEIISTRGQLTPMIPAVMADDDSVSVRWEYSQQPPMFIFNQFLPDPEGEARMWIDVTWQAPGNLQLSIGATQDPKARLDLTETVGQYDLHSVTPESPDTTHYFFATRRNHVEEDPEYNEMKIQGMHGAFANEDVPIIEAIHAEMKTDDFFSLDPVLMSNDVAPVKVRKILTEKINREFEDQLITLPTKRKA